MSRKVIGEKRRKILLEGKEKLARIFSMIIPVLGFVDPRNNQVHYVE